MRQKSDVGNVAGVPAYSREEEVYHQTMIMILLGAGYPPRLERMTEIETEVENASTFPSCLGSKIFTPQIS
jgi:hypothetical protein